MEFRISRILDNRVRNHSAYYLLLIALILLSQGAYALFDPPIEPAPGSGPVTPHQSLWFQEVTDNYWADLAFGWDGDGRLEAWELALSLGIIVLTVGAGLYLSAAVKGGVFAGKMIWAYRAAKLFTMVEPIRLYLEGRWLSYQSHKGIKPQVPLSDYYTRNVFNKNLPITKRIWNAASWALDDFMIYTGLDFWGSGVNGTIESIRGTGTYLKSLSLNSIKTGIINLPKTIWSGITRAGRTIAYGELPAVEAPVWGEYVQGIWNSMKTGQMIERAGYVGNICASFNLPLSALQHWRVYGELPTVEDLILGYNAEGMNMPGYITSFRTGMIFGGAMEFTGPWLSYGMSKVPYLNRLGTIESIQGLFAGRMNNVAPILNRIDQAVTEEMIREMLAQRIALDPVFKTVPGAFGYKVPLYDAFDSKGTMTGFGELLQESVGEGKPTLAGVVMDSIMQDMWDAVFGKTSFLGNGKASNPENQNILSEFFGNLGGVSLKRTPEMQKVFNGFKAAGINLDPNTEIQMERLFTHFGEYYGMQPADIIPIRTAADLPIIKSFFEAGVKPIDFVNFNHALTRTGQDITNIRPENIPVLANAINSIGSVNAGLLQLTFGKAPITNADIGLAGQFLNDYKVDTIKFAEFSMGLSQKPGMTLSQIRPANIPVLAEAINAGTLSPGNAALLQISSGNLELTTADIKVANLLLSNNKITPSEFANFNAVLSQEGVNINLRSVEANLPVIEQGIITLGGVNTGILQITSSGKPLQAQDIQVAKTLLDFGVKSLDLANFNNMITQEKVGLSLGSFKASPEYVAYSINYLNEAGGLAEGQAGQLTGVLYGQGVKVVDGFFSQGVTPDNLLEFSHVLGKAGTNLAGVGNPAIAANLINEIGGYEAGMIQATSVKPLTKADVNVAVSLINTKKADKIEVRLLNAVLNDMGASLGAYEGSEPVIILGLNSLGTGKPGSAGQLTAGLLKTSIKTLTQEDIAVARQLLDSRVAAKEIVQFNNVMAQLNKGLSDVIDIEITATSIKTLGGYYAGVLQATVRPGVKITQNDVAVAKDILVGGIESKESVSLKVDPKAFISFVDALGQVGLNLGMFMGRTVEVTTAINRVGAVNSAYLFANLRPGAKLTEADLVVAESLLRNNVSTPDLNDFNGVLNRFGKGLDSVNRKEGNLFIISKAIKILGAHNVAFIQAGLESGKEFPKEALPPEMGGPSPGPSTQGIRETPTNRHLKFFTVTQDPVVDFYLRSGGTPKDAATSMDLVSSYAAASIFAPESQTLGLINANTGFVLPEYLPTANNADAQYFKAVLLSSEMDVESGWENIKQAGMESGRGALEGAKAFIEAGAQLPAELTLSPEGLRQFMREKVLPVQQRIFGLTKEQTRSLSQAIDLLEFTYSGTHDVVHDRATNKTTVDLVKITKNMTKEQKLYALYEFYHEFTGHVIERVLSNNLVKGVDGQVLTPATIYGEALALSMPKIIAYALYKETRNPWYKALAAFYYEGGRLSDVWSKDVSFNKAIETLLKENMMPYPAYIQEECGLEFNPIGTEYSAEMRAFSELLNQYGFDLGRLFQDMLVVDKVSSISSEDLMPLVETREVVALSSSLKAAMSLHQTTSSVEFINKMLARLLATAARSKNVAVKDAAANAIEELLPPMSSSIESVIKEVTELCPG